MLRRKKKGYLEPHVHRIPLSLTLSLPLPTKSTKNLQFRASDSAPVNRNSHPSRKLAEWCEKTVFSFCN
jgi:hypothetical protein